MKVPGGNQCVSGHSFVSSQCMEMEMPRLKLADRITHKRMKDL
jgi:hypothetical protein